MVYPDEMGFVGIGAGAHVFGKLREGGDALTLKSLILGGEVAIDFGVTGNVATIGTEHVIG